MGVIKAPETIAMVSLLLTVTSEGSRGANLDRGGGRSKTEGAHGPY